VRRREFIAGLAGAAAWPAAARGQQGTRMRHIAVLMSGAESDRETQARLSGIRDGLSRFGWSEGRNLIISHRYAAANAEQAQASAKELVGQKPELIIAAATQIAAALRRETRDIPIVFVGVVDPIGIGLIDGLARPGTNATGTLLNEESIAGKWVAMLKELAPQTHRVAVLFSSTLGFFERTYRPAAETAARFLAIEVVPMAFADPADIERGLAALAEKPGGALLVPPDLLAVLHRDIVIALADKHRLPAVYQASFWVKAGGLMSYGADRVAAHRQVAYYVDRILRGASPADLPVQAPTKYETTLNLTTAKALGLSVPPGLLLAADEVIE
jgi:putative tryptophan/tyrosine transport system substrate-binding protein